MSSRPRVALGMSGGVDSSLSAHLLVDQGYDVTGVYLECWRAPGCRTDADRQDALKVALSLDIPFQVLDFKDAYRQRVVEYFFNEYQAGFTPNPDVMCNKEIKFGLFYDWAMANGFDYVATGHYAQVDHQAAPGELLTSADTHKDQTYFLHVLSGEQLKHTLFPIGHLTKPEVRAEAEQRGLGVAAKKDSVGICFIGDINVHEFLKDRLGENPGDVVDVQGNVIGQHKGLWFYTVGQRHGFTVNSKLVVTQPDGTEVNKHLLPPFYVIRKEPASNQLVVGFGPETYRDHLEVRAWHWISQPDLQQPVLVRIRHTGQLIPATLTGTKVQFSQPLQGVAEGQSAVIYQAGGPQGSLICRGGGVIVG